MLTRPQQRGSQSDQDIDRNEADPALLKLERELTRLSRLLIAMKATLRYKLERAHYAILCALEDNGPQPIGKIAHFLLLDNSTATRQVAALESRGLVARLAHPTDMRSSMIEITSRGRTLMREMQALRIEHLAIWLAEWRVEDRREFTRLLHAYNEVVVERLGR